MSSATTPVFFPPYILQVVREAKFSDGSAPVVIQLLLVLATLTVLRELVIAAAADTTYQWLVLVFVHGRHLSLLEGASCYTKEGFIDVLTCGGGRLEVASNSELSADLHDIFFGNLAVSNIVKLCAD